MDFDSETLQLLGLKALFAFLMVGAVMTMAGYSVLAERKVSAWMQGRVGPNRTALPFVQYIPFIGPFLKGLGIFQPLADGLKFLFKEEIVPGHVNKVYYYLAPLVALVPALTTMTVLPFGEYFDETGKSTPLISGQFGSGHPVYFRRFFPRCLRYRFGRMVVEQQISLSWWNPFIRPNDFLRTGHGAFPPARFSLG